MGCLQGVLKVAQAKLVHLVAREMRSKLRSDHATGAAFEPPHCTSVLLQFAPAATCITVAMPEVLVRRLVAGDEIEVEA